MGEHGNWDEDEQRRWRDEGERAREREERERGARERREERGEGRRGEGRRGRNEPPRGASSAGSACNGGALFTWSDHATKAAATARLRHLPAARATASRWARRSSTRSRHWSQTLRMRPLRQRRTARARSSRCCSKRLRHASKAMAALRCFHVRTILPMIFCRSRSDLTSETLRLLATWRIVRSTSLRR